MESEQIKTCSNVEKVENVPSVMEAGLILHSVWVQIAALGGLCSIALAAVVASVYTWSDVCLNLNQLVLFSFCTCFLSAFIGSRIRKDPIRYTLLFLCLAQVRYSISWRLFGSHPKLMLAYYPAVKFIGYLFVIMALNCMLCLTYWCTKEQEENERIAYWKTSAMALIILSIVIMSEINDLDIRSAQRLICLLPLVAFNNVCISIRSIKLVGKGSDKKSESA